MRGKAASFYNFGFRQCPSDIIITGSESEIILWRSEEIENNFVPIVIAAVVVVAVLSDHLDS